MHISFPTGQTPYIGPVLRFGQQACNQTARVIAAVAGIFSGATGAAIAANPITTTAVAAVLATLVAVVAYRALTRSSFVISRSLDSQITALKGTNEKLERALQDLDTALEQIKDPADTSDTKAVEAVNAYRKDNRHRYDTTKASLITNLQTLVELYDRKIGILPKPGQAGSISGHALEQVLRQNRETAQRRLDALNPPPPPPT